MIDTHADRAHSILGPSSAHRWLACTPSVQLEKEIPETESDYARAGTIAHELAEAKLRNYFFPKDFGKRKLNSLIKKMSENELWDKEILNLTEAYLDFVKNAALAFDVQPHVIIERKISYEQYVPGGFGTADCILISGDTVHVIDFKSGYNLVYAENNPQLMLYALGAYLDYRMLYCLKKVRMSIVLPRHSDGISTWECTIEDILKFAEHAKERAALALKGEGEYCPGSETCKYCNAGAICRARADENVKLAFSTEKKPPVISNSEVGEFIRTGEDIEKWLKTLKNYALQECLAGGTIDGWKAVEGRTAREWGDLDAAFEVLKKDGIKEEILWNRVPLSVAQIEKEITKDQRELIKSFVVRNAGKPTLAKESDKRMAITNKISAEDAFKEEI